MRLVVVLRDLAVRVTLRATAGAAVILGLLLLTPPAFGQSLTVLHTFTASGDGGGANGISAIDPSGNLYGTTSYGGTINNNCSSGCGIVFQLKHKNQGWLLSPIFSFAGGQLIDPMYGVVRATSGALYGVGYYIGAGQMYELRPSLSAPRSVLAPWMLSIVYDFNGSGSDAYLPVGEVTFDDAGNIYGASREGGAMNGGVVYELSFSGGKWTEKDLWDFGSGRGNLGSLLEAGVVMDQAGNLYGTTTGGGAYGCGTVYELSPTQSGFWNGSALYNFPLVDNQCLNAPSGVILDSHGNLYGQTLVGTSNSGVFQLAPSGGNWTYTLLYGATWGCVQYCYLRLALDSAGDVYGTTPGGTYCNGNECDEGTVFKLTPSGGGWTYALLWEFQFSQLQDGALPSGDVTVDSSGNVYGTTELGGDTSCNPPNGCGVAYEVTP